MGYPLLTVSLLVSLSFSSQFDPFELKVKQEQQGNNRVLTIEQRRFLADGTHNENLLWKIPINICTKSNPTEIVHQLYLDGEKQKEFLLEKVPETDWIKLNLFK